MQTINAYIYYPTVSVQLVSDLNIRTRNRQVYSPTIMLYKNATNTVRLLVKNQDQKPVEIFGFDVIVDLCDPKDESVIVRYAATVVNSLKGIAQVTFTGTDLQSLEARQYFLTVRKRVTDVADYPTYIDDNYSVRLPVEIHKGYIRTNEDPSYDLGYVSDPSESLLPDLGGLN